jgi:hypothetical protein
MLSMPTESRSARHISSTISMWRGCEAAFAFADDLVKYELEVTERLRIAGRLPIR